VVGVAAQDGEGAVELLGEEDADQAVGDGDLAEGDEAPRPRAQRRRVAIGAADREYHRSPAAALLLDSQQAARQLLAADQLTALVERDDGGVGRHLAQERRLVGHLVHRDLAVGAQPLEVLRLGRLEVLLLEATDRQDADLQAQ